MLKFVNYDIVFQEIPNETTLAIFLSNCPNRCRGCHSPHLRDNIGQELTREVLDELLRKYGFSATCICFMGGDATPLDIEYLAKYLAVQPIAPIKVAWYSGRDKLPNGFDISFFDYIKLGSYKEELGALTSEKTNQRLYRIVEGREMIDITYLLTMLK